MDNDLDTAAEPVADSPAVHVETETVQRSRPFLTLLCVVLVSLAFVAVQSIVVFAFIAGDLRSNPNLNIDEWFDVNQFDGNLLATSTLAGAVVCVPLTLICGWWLGGKSVRSSLGLRSTSCRTIIAWSLVILGYCTAMDWLTWMSGNAIAPDFMVNAYRSAASPILIWLALVVAAPLSEEFMFRGLMYGGLVNTRLGFGGTAVVTTIAWSALHVQYELVVMLQIAIGGLMFALARRRTESLYPCLAMHAAWNTVATLQAAYFAPS